MVNATATTIDPGHLSLAHLRRVWQTRVTLTLAPDSRATIEASAAAVQRIVARQPFGFRNQVDDIRRQGVPLADHRQADAAVVQLRHVALEV